MKEKKVFYSEFAYIIGIVALAFGTALSERADFGMSMVVAPAYILHLKVSEIFKWFSFGVAEYCTQAILLVATAISLRKFKPMYLFSFLTAIIYGIILDGSIKLLSIILGDNSSAETIVMTNPGTVSGMINSAFIGRIILFVLGMLFCSLGVSMLFHTYFAPEAYELLVKEVSTNFNTNINKTKTIYDCTSCVVAIIMSFIFFGLWHFEGVKIGTVICALLNGFLIGRFSKLFEAVFEFKDKLAIKKYFE